MATAKVPYASPTNANEYAADLLAYMGDPETAANRSVITAWVKAESPTLPGFNGLGTTLPLSGSTPVPGNSAGVQEYPSLADGLQAAKDMIEGSTTQTALAPQLQTDLASGKATTSQLDTDVLNSGWSGSGQDTYDASTIASELNNSSPATLASWTQPLPGGVWDPLNIPSEIAGGAASIPSSVSGAVGSAVGSAASAAGSATLKGIVSLATSSTGVRALLLLLGLIILVMGLKELTSDSGPAETVVNPTVDITDSAVNHAKKGGEDAGVAAVAA
jgi:hypothetical protein